MKVKLLLLFFLILSCSSPKTNFKREYSKVWKETIKSEAWKNSIEAGKRSTPIENTDFYASTTNAGPSQVDKVINLNTDVSFKKKYHFLVSRAYVKIIAEAEKADGRLKEEYERLNSEKEEINNKQNRVFKNNLALVNKRYHAHREMLEGLKSWNIFSEYGTNDLEFFMAENLSEATKMYESGKSDEGIISFLVYRLADLYHFDK